jgi:hypothetical protein
VAWFDNAEMPMVEGSNLGEAEPLRNRNDGGVDDTERQVDVGGDELCHALHVRCRDLGNMEPVVAKRPEKCQFRLRADVRLEQVANLSEHRRRNQQRPCGLSEQTQAGTVCVVLDIASRQQAPVSHRSMSAAQLSLKDLLGPLGQIRVRLKRGEERQVSATRVGKPVAHEPQSRLQLSLWQLIYEMVQFVSHRAHAISL